MKQIGFHASVAQNLTRHAGHSLLLSFHLHFFTSKKIKTQLTHIKYILTRTDVFSNHTSEGLMHSMSPPQDPRGDCPPPFDYEAYAFSCLHIDCNNFGNINRDSVNFGTSIHVVQLVEVLAGGYQTPDTDNDDQGGAHTRLWRQPCRLSELRSVASASLPSACLSCAILPSVSDSGLADIIKYGQAWIGKFWALEIVGRARSGFYVAEVFWSRRQGLDCHVRKFRNSAIIRENKYYIPKLWLLGGQCSQRDYDRTGGTTRGANQFEEA